MGRTMSRGDRGHSASDGLFRRPARCGDGAAEWLSSTSWRLKGFPCPTTRICSGSRLTDADCIDGQASLRDQLRFGGSANSAFDTAKNSPSVTR